MDENSLIRAASVAFIFAVKPFALILVMGTALWLTRKLFPRAESWLFSPITDVIRRLAARARRGRQEALPPAQEDVRQPARRPTDRG